MIDEKRKSDSLKSEFERYCNDIQIRQILEEDEYNEYFKDFVQDDNTGVFGGSTNVDHKRESFLAKKKVDSILFDRSKLIIRVLQFISNKLYANKEKTLARVLEWVLREIKEAKESIDRSSVPLEKAKKEVGPNSDLGNLFSFIEEYSNSQNKHKESIANYSKRSDKNITQQSSGIITGSKYPIIKKENPNFGAKPLKSGIDIFSNGKNKENKADSEEEIDISQRSLTDESFDKAFETSINIKPIIPLTDKIINSMGTPEFNIFKLQKETPFPLHVISNFIFIQKGTYTCFEYDKMDNFLTEIERGYVANNPYHNALHAADVAQTCFIYNKYGEIEHFIKLQKLDISALIISAIIHDYKHPGYNNNFMINTQSTIAIRYNDNSVLENYHVSEAFALIKQAEKFNILRTFNNEEIKALRKRIIDMVLHTDMVFHGKLMSMLKLKEELEDKTENMTELRLFNLQQEYLNIILHGADISNASKPINVYVEWAERVINEFWNQGDLEKEKKLPISFLCDRTTVTIAKSQIGFIDGVVYPYFSSLNTCFKGKLKFLIDNIEYNKVFYKKQKELDDMKVEND